MPGRMPVLGQHYVRKLLCQRVHDGHNLVAAFHRQCAARPINNRAKVILQVDHKECVGGPESHILQFGMIFRDAGSDFSVIS